MTADDGQPPPPDDFDRRLAAARSADGVANRKPAVARLGKAGDAPLGRGEQRSVGLAMRIGTDLVAAVLVGAGIGWLLDRLFGTAPWLLLVFFVLGCAAGIRNVIRIATLIGADSAAAAQERVAPEAGPRLHGSEGTDREGPGSEPGGGTDR